MIRIPDDVKRDILRTCRRLYERGLVSGTDGNVSVRIATNQVVVTPAGMCKYDVGSEDLVVCDLGGKRLAGRARASTELKVHLAAYAAREDVCAVVHAHPPYATAFAVAGLVPCEKLMPEAYLAVGRVALALYGTPSTAELVESLQPCLHDHDVVLLANHGALALGRDVMAAHHRMEALEQLCRITTIARQLGSERQLSSEELAKLEAIRGVYGPPAHNVPCYQCGWTPARPPAEVGASPVPESPGPKPSETAPGGSAPAPVRRAGYTEPAVHWPGNPPVWERPRRPETGGDDRRRGRPHRARPTSPAGD